MHEPFFSHIPAIEDTLGYVFRDKGLLMQAFTRTSFCNEQRDRDAGDARQSNEVLEFFGDSVLSAALVSLLMREHTARYAYGIRTALSEGDLSNIKSHLSDKKHLSEGMRALGLQRFLCMGEGDIKLRIENEPSVMEDLFESIVGAVYIDCDMDMPTVMRVVSRMLSLRSYLEPVSARPMQSYKNALQEFCADRRRRLGTPSYETVSEDGPEHCRTYTRACRIDGTVWGVGQGKNQKAAEAEAARAALEALRKAEAEGTLCPSVATQGDAIRALCAEASRCRLPAPVLTDLGAAEEVGEGVTRFRASCRVNDATVEALAPSKREAKQAAARAMLAQLRGEGS